METKQPLPNNTQEKQKKTKQRCPRCGSQNTYSNPRERGYHLYCNHCGYETFK